MSALARWAAALHALALPPEIVATAPSSPFAFDVALFSRRADEARDADTPSRRRALAALPPGGMVLDVGCGAGAASVALADRAGRIVGLDGQADMLEAFAERASSLRVPHETIQGRWPDAAPLAPVADVVVCHHVLYNAPDLGPFAGALTRHARERVVVELTAVHPLAWLAPLWRELHGLDRPEGPTAQDAVAALEELGLDIEVDRWSRPPTYREPEQALPFVRDRLCLAPERDPELRSALTRVPLPRERSLVTLTWPGDPDYQWDSGSPGTGERKVGSDRMANDPT
jgi:SAM-dependent methyltransferase